MNCTNGNCTCKTHLRFISKLYYDIVEAVFNAAETCIVHNQKFKKFPKVVPEWNTVTKQKHAIARSYYLTWVTKGKPTYGNLFDAMKSSKKHSKKHSSIVKASLNNTKLMQWLRLCSKIARENLSGIKQRRMILRVLYLCH